MSAPLALIADDDRDLADTLKKRLERLGLEVVLTFDGLTALNLAHTRRPDLICLDVNMPCGTGLCVSEMLAADADLRSVPVIILSGSSDEPLVRKCHELCNYYVLKCPNVWQRLEPLIMELLGDKLAVAC